LTPQYHGGTNFGRSTGGPFIATSYDYDDPIDEFGKPFSVLELFVRPGMVWALGSRLVNVWGYSTILSPTKPIFGNFK
jgi:hypothetical protein